MRKLNTALELISSKGTVISGVTVDVKGYSTAGDGGEASWKFNGVTGQTPSQSPSQLGDALINDASGNQWELVHGKTVILEKLGGVAALQAALNTRAPEIAWFSSSLNLDPVRYTIYSGQHLHGPGIDKSTLFVSASLSTTLAQFENEHPNFAVDGIRYDKDIKLSGFTIDGSARKYAAWLSKLDGTPITDPEFDYSPAGIIGQGGTIFDVVAADRRNPNYSDIGNIIKLMKIERPIVENVRITGHESISISDEGCLSARVRHCVFDNQGKIDNISSAVWAQSFGNPNNPPAGYQDTEDHATEYCYFECKRSAISLSPTKGGAFRFNNVAFAGESTVFSQNVCNANGGRVDVHNNSFGPTVMTDIISDHVEKGTVPNYYIYNNRFVSPDSSAVSMGGGVSNSVHGNEFINVPSHVTLAFPYGPFSERYALNVGSTPIAGEPTTAEPIIKTGIQEAAGANGQDIYNNFFIDDRVGSPCPGIVGLFKAGASNKAKNISIYNNDRTRISDTSIPIIYQIASDVMEASMSLSCYGNKGDVSEVSAKVTLQIPSGGTGLQVVDIGFRPRIVLVRAALNNGSLGASWNGSTHWSPVRQDFGVSDNNANFASAHDNEFFRLTDGSGAAVVNAEFTAWTETGFSFNVISSSQVANLQLECIA